LIEVAAVVMVPVVMVPAGSRKAMDGGGAERAKIEVAAVVMVPAERA